MIIHYTGEFESNVKNNKVLIKFTAPWCAPCKRLDPILNELSQKISTDIMIVDIDQYPEVPSKYGIASVPTVLALNDGILVDQLVGLHKAEKYKELADKLI